MNSRENKSTGTITIKISVPSTGTDLVQENSLLYIIHVNMSCITLNLEDIFTSKRHQFTTAHQRDKDTKRKHLVRREHHHLIICHIFGIYDLKVNHDCVPSIEAITLATRTH